MQQKLDSHLLFPLAAVAVALGLAVGCSSARAQNRDGEAIADTAAIAATDSLQKILPPEFPSTRTASSVEGALSDSIPARVYAYEFVDLLRKSPASFLYDLGSYGWPHVWSPYGLSQQNVGVIWNGVEFSDLFTGRARYEAIPFGAADQPTFSLGSGGRLAQSVVVTRPYEGYSEPLTEFRYQSGGGLQKVTALHTQTRRVHSGGSGLLNLLFWYRGEGSSGEYPGSGLRRGRQVYGRVVYAQQRWSLEITELNTRHPLQAQAGVVPRSGDFNSIYQRLGAEVLDEDSRRRTLRNDLYVRWIRDTRPGTRTSLSVGRSDENLEFRRPGDTLEVASTRHFATFAQQTAAGNHALRADVSGRIGTAEARTDTTGFDSVTDRRLYVNVSDAFSSGAIRARALLGLDVRPEGTGAVTSASFNIPLGPASIGLDVASRPETATALELVGFGPFVTVSGDRPVGRTSIVAGRLTVETGNVDVSLLASLATTGSWRDLFATPNRDSVRVRSGDGTLRVVATGVDAGYRRHARSGLYLTATPTLFRVANRTTSDLERYDASLPNFYAVGRLGARARIFRGDLDLDAFLRGRFWSRFRSRVLHTPSGLLALPVPDSRPVESSAALDIVVEGRVRVATLFLAYENFLSGTAAIPGNMIVPVYPLAERRVRFGVFWPITN